MVALAKIISSSLQMVYDMPQKFVPKALGPYSITFFWEHILKFQNWVLALSLKFLFHWNVWEINFHKTYLLRLLKQATTVT